MKTITLKNNLTMDSIEIKNIIENIKQIEFHQKKTCMLTECVLSQCADILQKGKIKKPEKIT